MATSTVYIADGHYGNGDNGSYTNSAGLSIYVGPYSGVYYRSRLLLPSLRSQLGWGDRLVKISNIVLYMRNAESGTATVPVTAGVTTSSAWGATRYGSATANHSKSTVGWRSISMPNAGAYVVNYTSNWYIHLTGSSARIRYNGHNSDYKPYIQVTWAYSQSSGSLSNSSAIHLDALDFTVNPAGSDYTHVVEWYINGEETPYYTQNLAAGEVNSQCTFFGDTPSGSSLAIEDYFSQIGESVPVSVKLITYDASGTELGSNTYSATLTYTNLITTITSVSPFSLIYGEPISINLKVRVVGNKTVLNHYIGDKICLTEELNIDDDTTLTRTYPIEDVYNYFSYYRNSNAFKLEAITYDSNGENIGSVYYDSTITCEEKQKKLIQINHDIIVTTDTIISNNYFDNVRETFSISLNRIKNQLVDYLRPVGSIYMSYDSTDPSELFGGTWEEYSSARTLMSTIDETAIGSTGGSFTHTLTVSEMPSHRHVIPYTADTYRAYTSNYSQGYEHGYGSSTVGNAIGSAGSGGSHVNAQPYSACYMWIRTA